MPVNANRYSNISYADGEWSHSNFDAYELYSFLVDTVYSDLTGLLDRAIEDASQENVHHVYCGVDYTGNSIREFFAGTNLEFYVGYSSDDSTTKSARMSYQYDEIVVPAKELPEGIDEETILGGLTEFFEYVSSVYTEYEYVCDVSIKDGIDETPCASIVLSWYVAEASENDYSKFEYVQELENSNPSVLDEVIDYIVSQYPKENPIVKIECDSTEKRLIIENGEGETTFLDLDFVPPFTDNGMDAIQQWIQESILDELSIDARLDRESSYDGKKLTAYIESVDYSFVEEMIDEDLYDIFDVMNEKLDDSHDLVLINCIDHPHPGVGETLNMFCKAFNGRPVIERKGSSAYSYRSLKETTEPENGDLFVLVIYMGIKHKNYQYSIKRLASLLEENGYGIYDTLNEDIYNADAQFIVDLR